MNPSRLVETFELEIGRERAYRLLGIRPEEREPLESVVRDFDRELAAARGLIEARTVSLTSHSDLRGSAFFDDEAPLTLVVCTIGDALEQRVAELSDRGHVVRAMLLDALGSAAAEELADRSNRRICEEALRAGLDPGPRVSPGCGAWKLEGQVWLFRELAPQEIGVTLGEAHMMTPRKSVSYAVPLAGGTDRARGRCIRCGLVDCTQRTG